MKTFSLNQTLNSLIQISPKEIENLISQTSDQRLTEALKERAFFESLTTFERSVGKQPRSQSESQSEYLLALSQLLTRYADFRFSLHATAQKKKAKKNPGPSSLDYFRLNSCAVDLITHDMRSDTEEWFAFIPVFGTDTLGTPVIVENGTRTHVLVNLPELFRTLLLLRPQGVYFFHNHSNGDATPSYQDLKMTENLRKLAKTFHIAFIGHCVVTLDNERWIQSDDKNFS